MLLIRRLLTGSTWISLTSQESEMVDCIIRVILSDMICYNSVLFMLFVKSYVRGNAWIILTP